MKNSEMIVHACTEEMVANNPRKLCTRTVQ